MWDVRVAPLLNGEAQAVYQALGVESTQDYKIFKVVILAWLHLMEEAYWHQF